MRLANPQLHKCCVVLRVVVYLQMCPPLTLEQPEGKEGQLFLLGELIDEIVSSVFQQIRIICM